MEPPVTKQRTRRGWSLHTEVCPSENVSKVPSLQMVLDCVRDQSSGIGYKYCNYDQFDFTTKWQMLGIQDYDISLQLRVISTL